MAKGTFLQRLRRDTRGNTLAIMAAAMVPLMGFTGSAIDMARMYVVKTRLQQACDAGVLAGRKAMTDTQVGTQLDTTAKAQADTFFANNFQTGWYNTKTVSFTPTKSIDGDDSTVANAVRGEAKATVPMAVMGFFGMPDRDLVVTCQARFDLADSDIMFVLDTTGSMGCVPSAAANCGGVTTSYTRGDGTTGYYAQEASGSKMQGLRDAVMLFDETMRANADTSTNFRYGFVTYSSSVNVGKIIPPQYLQSTTHDYQSRRVTGDYNFGASSTVTQTGVGQPHCVNKRVPATGYELTGAYYSAKNYTNASWATGSGGSCTYTVQTVRAMWRYEKLALNISGYVAGNSVTVPGRLDGLTSKWRGCIEEVNTSASGSFNVEALPNDLNPDFKPSADDNKWRPMWPEATWLRGDFTNAVDKRDDQIQENTGNEYEDHNFRPGGYFDQNGSAACGMPAQRLKVWTRQQVSDYVNNVDFKPFGGTYHDAGMIWGARMLSPDGIFENDTASWPGRNEPSRSIVFMTDGNLSTSPLSSGLYGPEYWNKRVTGGDYGSQTARHNARFRVSCDAAKKKGITIYVVAFGSGVTMSSDLTYCASPGQAFPASDTAALRDAFSTIAKRVASLRITQ
jgi:Flp pilus assembly protein TadG